jgi:hypothetical protein
VKGEQGEPAGTVVRIVANDPQVVAVCWDGDDPLNVSVMPLLALLDADVVPPLTSDL